MPRVRRRQLQSAEHVPGICTGKVADYRRRLRGPIEWEAYLRAESRLPGRRANLEFIHAAAAEGARDQFLAWLSSDAGEENAPEEFVTLCAIVGLGKPIAEGERDMFAGLRRAASDSRWRVREAVAMALQRVGATDFDLLVDELEGWADGTRLSVVPLSRGFANGRCSRIRRASSASWVCSTG
jgi:hypothetical protein